MPTPRKPHVIALVWSLLVAALVSPATVRAAATLPPPGEYRVEPSGSKVGFHVTHFAIAGVDGTFKTFSGHVVLGDSLATAHLEATVDVASIDTGSEGRDKHLRSPDFFDVARFPRMSFTSSQVWGTAESFGIRGKLTIKGTTHEVVFTARVEDTGLIRAETTLDRKDYGLGYGSTINDEVKLRLDIQLARVG